MFCKNPLSGSHVDTCGQPDERKYTKAPKMDLKEMRREIWTGFIWLREKNIVRHFFKG
jgi:hypothetical protein